MGRLLKRFEILTCAFLLLVGQNLSAKEEGFSEVIQSSATTVQTYEKICRREFVNSQSFSEDWANICPVVRESEACSEISQGERLLCESPEENQLDVMSWSFMWNCAKGLTQAFVEMLKFIKEAIFWVTSYVAESGFRESRNEKIADLHEGMVNYVANEYTHIKKNTDASDSKAWLILSASLVDKAMEQLGKILKENYYELGCYNQKARQKRVCKLVGDIVMPPAAFFSFLKAGPKAAKSFPELRAKLNDFPRKKKDSESSSDSEVEKSAQASSERSKASLSKGAGKEAVTLKGSSKAKGPKKVKGLDEEYWSSQRPYTVAKEGKEYPVTYSFDSEIPHSDVFRMIYKDPEATRKLSEALSEIKVVEKGFLTSNSKKYVIDREELKRVLDKSDKQIDTFVLRKGVDKRKKEFQLTDLNPGMVDEFMVPMLKQFNMDKKVHDSIGRQFDQQSIDNFFEKYRNIAAQQFEKHEIPANATRDQMWVEMVHKSSESTPSDFRSLIFEKFQPLSKSAATHLHVGVPAVVEKPQMMAISRAVEARIILQRAQNTSRPTDLYAPYYSTLRKGDDPSNRNAGVVRMNYNRFSKPHPAHDLEIRQYNSTTEGMNNLAFAGKLASKHERLKALPDFEAPKVFDPGTSNLNGALRYVSEVFKDSGDTDLVRVADEMEELAKKIENQNSVTPEVRAEVKELLGREKVLENFNENVLLKGDTYE